MHEDVADVLLSMPLMSGKHLARIESGLIVVQNICLFFLLPIFSLIAFEPFLAFAFRIIPVFRLSCDIIS